MHLISYLSGWLCYRSRWTPFKRASMQCVSLSSCAVKKLLTHSLPLAVVADNIFAVLDIESDIQICITVRNIPSAAVWGGDFWRAAKTGGRRTPERQPMSQHRCLFDRAGALKGWLRCVWIFDWKDWQNKKSAVSATRHHHVAGDIPWAERYRFRRVVWNRC